MENTFNGGNATWEITRYSGVVHGYTKFSDAEAYNPVADARSWNSMLNSFNELLAVPMMDMDGTDAPEAPTAAPEDSAAGSIRVFASMFLAGVLATFTF